MADKGARRGSSLFSNPGGAAQAGGGGAPADNQGPKRQSVVLPGLGGGVGFGIDFDDSDYDDSDDEDIPHGGPYGGQGGLPGQAMPGSASGTAAVTGAQNSRPLVGGFAAAAYEAARAHHFQNVAKQQAMKGGKQGEAPQPKK